MFVITIIRVNKGDTLSSYHPKIYSKSILKGRTNFMHRFHYSPLPYFVKILIVCLLIELFIVLSIFIDWYNLHYRGISPHPSRSAIESIPMLVSATLAILFIGFLTDRKALRIKENSIMLSLQRFQITKKREINLNEINKIYSKKYVPRYLRWYTPWGLAAMTGYRLSSQEYEERVGKDVVWIETQNGKSYFLAHKEEFPDIHSKLKEIWREKLEMINVEVKM